MPLISVDALKKLVYEKSGYQMQLSSGDDPLLTTIYINQVVLGQAIEYATRQISAANDLHIQKLENNYRSMMGQVAGAIQQPVGQIAGAQEGLAKFIQGEMRAIYSAAKAAREQNLYLLEGAVVTAVSNGYSGLTRKGNKIFDEAAGEFLKAINSCAGETSEALKTLCRDINGAADTIRQEQWRSQMIGMMAAAVGTGVLVGVLTVLILK